MSPVETLPPLVVIVGPTAVGKTDLAIELAEKLNGEIISADSRLFYRGMDIGTAKPTKQEQERVTHHLIDVANPDETWSLALFKQKASEIIRELHEQQKLPFLVGGSGQYIQSITEGWAPPEIIPNQRMRVVLENLVQENSPEWLHQRLRILDPTAANNIDARNIRRTIRAMEVILSSGRPFSSQRTRSDSPFNVIMIGLWRPRVKLYARVDERIENMFSNGLLGEVQSLLARGYSPDLPSLSAIGYREAIAVLEKKITLDEAKMRMKRLTRVFVRRQANWFKMVDPKITWFEMGAGTSEVVEKSIVSRLRDSQR